MKPIEVSRTMAGDLASVFARFTDLEALEARIPAIQRVEVLSEGPFGEGTRWRETRRMFGHDSTEEMWVTACNPPHGYDLEADSHGSRYLTAFRFEPAGDGAVRVNVTFAARPRTLVARVMGLLMEPMMRGTVVGCFEEDLKAMETGDR